MPKQPKGRQVNDLGKQAENKFPQGPIAPPGGIPPEVWGKDKIDPKLLGLPNIPKKPAKPKPAPAPTRPAYGPGAQVGPGPRTRRIPGPLGTPVKPRKLSDAEKRPFRKVPNPPLPPPPNDKPKPQEFPPGHPQHRPPGFIPNHFDPMDPKKRERLREWMRLNPKHAKNEAPRSRTVAKNTKRKSPTRSKSRSKSRGKSGGSSRKA